MADKTSYLTLDEEISHGRIIKAFREGDESVTATQCQGAIEKIWIGNKKAVYKLVHTFFKWFKAADYYPLEEAIADATLEFIRFVSQKYEPDRGYKVMTGATSWVQKTLRVNSGKYRTVELKGAADWKYINIAKSINIYEEDKSLQNVDLITYLKNEYPKMKQDDIISLVNLHGGVSSFDFEFTGGEKPYTLSEITPDNKCSSDIEFIMRKEIIDTLMSNLSDKEQAVIKIKFDLEYIGYSSIEEYLEKTGMSKKEFKEYSSSAIRKLRNASIKKGLKLCEIL